MGYRLNRTAGVNLAFLVASVTALGCTDGTEARGPGDEVDPAGQPDAAAPTVSAVGTADPPMDDPTDIQVVPEDDEVVVTLGELEPGAYEVAIVSVDGAQVFSAADWESDPESSDSEALVARLKVPSAVDSQAELVQWNLKVTRKGEEAQPVLMTSLLYFLEPHEVQLEGPSKVTLGKEVAYRVVARHPVTRKGIANRKVVVRVGQGDKTKTLEAETDEFGVANVKLELDEAGGYEVQAEAEGSYVAAKVASSVQGEAVGNKLLLTTDKPLYKPGQTIHLRTLALQRSGNTPLADTNAVLEVEDGKGNKIFKKTLSTDAFGIASAPFKIGNIVNEGTFTIRATVGESVSEKTVQVSQYALPKFKVSTRTDKPWYLAGDNISGVVDARYFFGKAVQGGSILVEAATLDVGRNVYQQVMGQTNAEGLFEFTVGTPSTLVGLPIDQGMALINLTVTATDTAGQAVSVETLVSIASEPLTLSVVPEGTSLIAGLPNRLTIFATDPLGAPLSGAEVSLQPQTGAALTATADAQGFAEIVWTPEAGQNSLVASVSHAEATVDNLSFNFGAQAGTEHVLVRTDKSVYDVGETVSVEVLTSDAQGSVFVDWLNDGQAVDLRTLEPNEGSASFSLTLDETLLGENRIDAYIVQEDGNLVRAGRTVFVRNASSLNVEIETDQAQYTPGASAEITFSVTDEAGSATAAALGVQIVDEAVFALIDARPGLLNTYFELEDQFAQPSYELHPPPGSLANLIFDRPTGAEEQSAAQSKAEATFAALGAQALMGLSARSWPEVVTQGNQLLTPVYESERQRLIALVDQFVAPAIAQLETSGCNLDSWWCDAQQQSLGQLFATELQKRVAAFDFWGNAYVVSGSEYTPVQLLTWGPDETAGTPDDHTFAIAVSDLDAELVDLAVVGSPSPDGALGGGPVVGLPGNAPAPPAASAGGEPESAPDPTEAPAEEGGAAEPRVRREFPETLYFNPAVITDGSGKATVSLDLADSITQWRISSLANSAGGKLGSAVGAMTVFQDFFVDVNFPATLTRGDEIAFPIAVYNYLDEPQTVNIELQTDTWYTALGETALSVELQAGEVKGVSFPVRVDEVGLKTLTVNGIGSQASDAVARSVRVVPDGKPLPNAQSGSVATTVSHIVNFDAAAVPGSEQLYVNVYPTFLSQAVSGLDSMLQVPNGCFEQTTATAWPNVLVTRYMQETDQITPEVLLKAESLMSAGYQRLLTFEHPGGGFSWFGTQDAAPFLSVTAFGLMEFHDMAKVHEVDPAMLERTLAYLLSQQQADGSWQGDQSEFFSFHTSALRNTAFTLMAVGSAAYTGPEVTRAVDFIRAQLSAETLDDYTVALVANAMLTAAPNDPLAGDLLEQLAAAATVDAEDDTRASWDSGDTQTNFYGYGNDAAITTTAMAVHALLLSGGHAELVSQGLNFLTASKDSLGNFGSTQATVWTLKTLLLAASMGTEAAIGDLVVEVDGEVVQTLSLTEAQSDVMTTVDLAAFTQSGEHTVELTFSGEGKVSYNLVSNYHLPWTEAGETEEGPLSVDIAYDRTQLQVDETVTASVRVTNNTASTQNMALVTVGLPPGFEVQSDDFALYLAANVLSKVEVTGKQVILYVSELAPNAELVFDYRLRATMPVKASDGGGEVHLYYQPDKKKHAPEQQIEVLPPA